MVLDMPSGRIARPIITIDEGASVVEASKAMVENNRGSVVVTGRGVPVGILTERDVMKRVVAKSLDPASTKASEVMTASPLSVDKEVPLREAIDLMNRRGLRRMLVTEDGKITGIFTLRDIVKHTRVCLYCGKEIRSILESNEPDAFVECECGSRYHRKCADTVVNCVTCSKTLVTNVVYPEPSETFSG
jgi:CBS domain-containing protein/DNA-directed RNA polymerase subunit RPC12/RpoP